MILDSLDDISCLTDCPEHDREFLMSVLDDTHLHALLEVSPLFQSIVYGKFVWHGLKRKHFCMIPFSNSSNAFIKCLISVKRYLWRWLSVIKQILLMNLKKREGVFIQWSSGSTNCEAHTTRQIHSFFCTNKSIENWFPENLLNNKEPNKKLKNQKKVYFIW